jgi:hypothetical protein
VGAANHVINLARPVDFGALRELGNQQPPFDLRHASAMTTLNTYGHVWPDKDESSRAAVAVALAAREDKSRTREAIN